MIFPSKLIYDAYGNSVCFEIVRRTSSKQLTWDKLLTKKAAENGRDLTAANA